MGMKKLASKYPKTAGALGTATTWGGWDIINSILNALPAGKDGGRVTPRGIGKAKRGFGRAMKRKR
jgi:hypothetical protein